MCATVAEVRVVVVIFVLLLTVWYFLHFTRESYLFLNRFK